MILEIALICITVAVIMSLHSYTQLLKLEKQYGGKQVIEDMRILQTQMDKLIKDHANTRAHERISRLETATKLDIFR